MGSNGIGVLPGHHQSYIDHLVPLCQILGLPLLVTDPWVQELIERYYPPMPLLLADPEDYNLDAPLKGYDYFVYVDFFRLASGSFQFQQYLCTHKVRSVMSLHGNPDKYWQMYWLEKLNDEDIVLAYGPQLVELLRQKGVAKQPVITGNYRLAFYEQHAPFFDSKLPFQKKKPIVLYAPTWACAGKSTAYREQYTSFFQVYRTVFETLSGPYQLIVKLHPHLMKMMPEETGRVIEDYPEIYFLHDFPLIYPLLKQVDYYLSDYSSIGYDFLYFDRPLFFLETQSTTALHTCGRRLRLEDLPHLSSPSFPRLEMYRHVFGETKELAALKRDIEDARRSSPL